MPFLTRLQVDVPNEGYPFSIPAIRALERGLKLHPKVTFLVGENGSGMSTLLEGFADKWGGCWTNRRPRCRRRGKWRFWCGCMIW